MKLFDKNNPHGKLWLILFISAALHVVGLFIFGIVTIAQAVLREEETFEPPPIVEVPQRQPEYMVNLEQKNQSSSPPRPNPITVDSPDVTLPALNIDLNVANATSYARGTGGAGTGGGMSSIREMATATVFGIEVSATKLGIVVDVSRSTHDVLGAVIDEIQKNFRDAIIVMVPNASVGNAGVDLFPVEDYEAGEEKHPAKNRYSTASNINRVLGRNKDFEKIWRDMGRDNRGYVVFPEGDSIKNDAGGVGVAMDKLREEAVDAIYWFGDFNDDISDSGKDELLSILKRGRIALYIHDFKAPLGSRIERRHYQTEYLEELASRTQGDVFLKDVD